MSAVTKHEIVDVLEKCSFSLFRLGNLRVGRIADAIITRIAVEGIAPEPESEEANAPPEGRTPVAWAIDTPYGRAYSFADEVIGKWPVPDGWVLVPIDPTDAMQTAHDMYGDTSDWWNAVISAVMRAAAPEVKP